MRVTYEAGPAAGVDYPLARGAGGALVVGRWADGALAGGDGVAAGLIERAVRSAPGFKGGEGQSVVVLAPAGLGAGRLVLLGLGERAGLDAARLRKLGGALAGLLLCSGAAGAAIDLGLSAEQAVQLGLGLRLAAWRPTNRHRSTIPDELRASLTEAVIGCDDPGRAAGLDRRWRVLAEEVGLARDLMVEPANALTPAALAGHAERAAELGIAVEILDETALARDGLTLLAAVGQGSVHPPRLAVLRWRGAGDDRAPLVFAGKGITFDAGGLSIKGADGMEKMKGDMGGAAAALAALRVLAGRGARVNAAAVLALAENLPSGRALRPGDVLRSYSGRTVEVVDTDAEGRLVLADAIAWACANLKPAALVDLATLTGAMITTLGRHHAGLFASDDALAERLLAAGRATGEKVWRLPMGGDDNIKSDIADVKNCAWGRVPDALDAARFLQGFVAEGVAWAHLDIAGTASGDDGPTGFGVRLLDALAEGYEG